MKSIKLAALIIYATIATLAVCSCNKSDNEEAARRIERLSRLDDSITVLAPSALDSINAGLKANRHDSTAWQEYRLRLARYYWLSDNPQRADSVSQNIIQYIRRQDNGYYDTHYTCKSPRLNSIMAGAIACQATRNHNFHKAPQLTIKLYSTAYWLYSHSDRKDNMPKTCANLADAYIQANDIPNAAKWYRRALFLVDSLNMPKKENITLYMGLAQIYLSLHDFQRAEIYYNQTERYFSLMSPQMQAYHITNLGNFYYYSHDYTKALHTFKRLEKLLVKNGMQNKFDMYICKVNLADVYLNLNRLDEARHYLSEAEPFFIKNDDPTAIYYCNTIRLGIAVRSNNTTDVRHILESEHIKQDIPYTMVDIRNKYLRGYYEQTGDYRKAYSNLQENIRYNDSLDHNRSNMRSAEIMARFTADTLQLHHDLALEHKNTDIQRANMKATTAVSVAVVLALLMTLWFMYTRKKQLQNQVSIMNLKLNNVRNRISPHFMFNVLNNKIVNSDKKEASELMELAKLIRTNLDMSSQPCMVLSKELEFVKQYIRVERYLLGDDFTFAIDIASDVDTGKVRIPSMFLQILTENAIVHGLKGIEGHKKLHIDITRENEATAIRVADNGPGFNACRALKKGTGLGIISQTIAVTNEHNKHKMRFEIKNLEDAEGNVKGCEATLKVPDNITFK